MTAKISPSKPLTLPSTLPSQKTRPTPLKSIQRGILQSTSYFQSHSPVSLEQGFGEGFARTTMHSPAPYTPLKCIWQVGAGLNTLSPSSACHPLCSRKLCGEVLFQFTQSTGPQPPYLPVLSGQSCQLASWGPFGNPIFIGSEKAINNHLKNLSVYRHSGSICSTQVQRRSSVRIK